MCKQAKPTNRSHAKATHRKEASAGTPGARQVKTFFTAKDTKERQSIWTGSLYASDEPGPSFESAPQYEQALPFIVLLFPCVLRGERLW